MSTQIITRQQIIGAIQELPGETLPEVAEFVEFLRFRTQKAKGTPPYEPVALGGLWEGIVLTEADIAEARREMWNSLGERSDL